VPTAIAAGVAAAVPVTIAPLAIMVEQGMAAVAAVAEVQQRPVVAAEQATKI
jgi:hypothetical protein